MKTLLLFCFILIARFLSGQNLVMNPSFEEYTMCPPGLDYIQNATGWLPIANTPDYFSPCDSFVSDNSASAPCNVFGCQTAASGYSYAGFWAKIESSEYREALNSQLVSNLQIGTKYYISLKINLTPYSQSAGNCGVNNIGILFSTSNYAIIPAVIQNNFAHVYSNTIVTDTSNWTVINGSFIADSTYSFVNIGNFFTDSLTDSIQLSGSSCYAYYFVDDICVSPDSTQCDLVSDYKEPRKEPINVYPNPANDKLVFTEKVICTVYSILGEPLLRMSTPENVLDVSALPTGTYLLHLTYNNKSYYRMQSVMH